MTNIFQVQTILREHKVEAWALLDYKGSNPIAWEVLGLPPKAHCTRRWAVIIPAEGDIVKIVHAIEAHTLEGVPAGKTIKYSTVQEWHAALESIAKQYPVLAAEYSPNCDIPSASRLDAGTMELLRSFGTTIISSADIAQSLTAVWSEQQIVENQYTANALHQAMMFAFDSIREALRTEQTTNEFKIQRKVIEFFARKGLVTDHPPIVAVNANAANPHYTPTIDNSQDIIEDDLVLIDMWAKGTQPWSTFSDITWMGYCGETAPERLENIFGVVVKARDAVVEKVQSINLAETHIRGCDLDDISRNVIVEAGYGRFFIHRTGHSITTETHGSGACLDNYETHDTRRILPGTSFSVEPGIYIPGDVGFRSELNVVVSRAGIATVPAPIQEKILCLT